MEGGLTPFEGGQPDLSDEEILCFALERIYRDGMSRPQFKGLAHAPSADRADDEYLSQDHGLPAEEHTTPIHEDLLWDDCSKDVLAPTRRFGSAANSWFLDVPSDGEYGNPFDMELDHYDEDLMNEDEHWNDYDLFPLELPYAPEGYYFRPGLRIDQTPDFEGALHDENSHTPPVLDFEDDDVVLDSFLDSSRPEHLGLEGRAAESNAFRLYLYGGHITCEDDRNSQDSVGQILELGGRSQAASSIASLCSPPISGLLSISEEVDLRGKQQIDILCRHRRQGQLTGPKVNHDGNTSLYVGDDLDPAILRVSHSDPHDDDGDELEFNILSDTDSNISAHTKTNFEVDFDLVKRGGVSVAIGTRPSFPEASISHHSLTLDVTWPRQPDCDRQLREFQEEFEDSDEGLWRGELVGKSAQAAGMDLEDDSLSVMDFEFETDAP
ncbi:hypothetical protein D9615_002792 [Tricholomella constricta]|uniref:Uncharacterized protein n=1 Tax=Tricholomella constricta TaxID=117010 RepID=A0A8H5HFH7_9AGAR|nr:hypothetical protein D9615_002792 [Tricholomella constricta]